MRLAPGQLHPEQPTANPTNMTADEEQEGEEQRVGLADPPTADEGDEAPKPLKKKKSTKKKSKKDLNSTSEHEGVTEDEAVEKPKSKKKKKKKSHKNLTTEDADEADDGHETTDAEGDKPEPVKKKKSKMAKSSKHTKDENTDLEAGGFTVLATKKVEPVFDSEDSEEAHDAKSGALSLEGAKRASGFKKRQTSMLAVSDDPFAAREGKTLLWRNINMTLKGSGKNAEDRALLRDVWGEVPEQQTTAIMGPSGAGKTSLLNILAGRAKTRGRIVIDADVRLNNYQVDPTNIAVRKNIAFVAQDDSLQVTSTPRESIYFSAKLRLPRTTPEKNLHKLVRTCNCWMGPLVPNVLFCHYELTRAPSHRLLLLASDPSHVGRTRSRALCGYVRGRSTRQGHFRR